MTWAQRPYGHQVVMRVRLRYRRLSGTPRRKGRKANPHLDDARQSLSSASLTLERNGEFARGGTAAGGGSLAGPRHGNRGEVPEEAAQSSELVLRTHFGLAMMERAGSLARRKSASTTPSIFTVHQ